MEGKCLLHDDIWSDWRFAGASPVGAESGSLASSSHCISIPELNLFNALQQHFRPTFRPFHSPAAIGAARRPTPHRCLVVQPIAHRSRCIPPHAAFAPVDQVHPERASSPDATRGGSKSGEFPCLPVLRSTGASVKSKPLSFKNTPRREFKAQSKRVFAQRMRRRAFQSFPFSSISGAESRLINALRARSAQELFSFPFLWDEGRPRFQTPEDEHRPCRPENLRAGSPRAPTLRSIPVSRLPHDPCTSARRCQIQNIA